jgi:hypothetical protein
MAELGTEPASAGGDPIWEGELLMRSGLSFVLRLVGLALLAAAPAQAIPLTLDIYADGVLLETVDETDLGCVDTGPDTATCHATDLAYSNESYVALTIDEISLDLDSDPVVTGTTSVSNAQAFTQQFTLVFTLPVVAMPFGTLTGGSHRGTVTDVDGNGATVGTALGSSLYTALLDGADWQSLRDDPFSASAGGFGSNSIPNTSFGAPIPSLPGPAVLSSIGIRLDFTLTAFDRASFTSNHVVEPIPEPTTGALVALGLALLAMRRRRH